MYQLYREGGAAHGEGSDALFQTAQAIRVDNPVYRILIRVALIPVIAGISYEIIRLAGKSNNILVRIISAPGMWLQRLTTREPDESMVEVAIAAVEAVFDWKGYIKETFGYEVDESWMES